MTREYTNKLLDMIAEVIDKDTVILACINYMSEADVKDMMECNDFIDSEDTV